MRSPYQLAQDWLATEARRIGVPLDAVARLRARVHDLLASTETTTDAWRLAVATGRQWPLAKRRTEEERRAIWLGESYNHRTGRRRRIFFAVPTGVE